MKLIIIIALIYPMKTFSAGILPDVKIDGKDAEKTIEISWDVSMASDDDLYNFMEVTSFTACAKWGLPEIKSQLSLPSEKEVISVSRKVSCVKMPKNVPTYRQMLKRICHDNNSRLDLKSACEQALPLALAM